MDERRFTDTFDLFRPTVARSAGGTETVVIPDTATSTGNPCLFLPGKQPSFTPGVVGIVQEHDAMILAPATTDLRAQAKGQQPDHVVISGREYTVLSAEDAAGRGHHLAAKLKEV